MKAKPLMGLQLSRVNEIFSDLEEIEASVFVGSKDAYNDENSLAMHVIDSSILTTDYANRGRETIEQLFNDTNITGDIDQCKPWDGRAGEIFCVVGWIAWSVDDTEFLNLEWERVKV